MAARYSAAGNSHGVSRASTHQQVSANSAPVPASTSGYRAEIGSPQSRHRPRSHSHPSTGTLSQGRIR